MSQQFPSDWNRAASLIRAKADKTDPALIGPLQSWETPTPSRVEGFRVWEACQTMTQYFSGCKNFNAQKFRQDCGV